MELKVEVEKNENWLIELLSFIGANALFSLIVIMATSNSPISYLELLMGTMLITASARFIQSVFKYFAGIKLKLEREK